MIFFKLGLSFIFVFLYLANLCLSFTQRKCPLTSKEYVFDIVYVYAKTGDKFYTPTATALRQTYMPAVREMITNKFPGSRFGMGYHADRVNLPFHDECPLGRCPAANYRSASWTVSALPGEKTSGLGAIHFFAKYKSVGWSEEVRAKKNVIKVIIISTGSESYLAAESTKAIRANTHPGSDTSELVWPEYIGEALTQENILLIALVAEPVYPIWETYFERMGNVGLLKKPNLKNPGEILQSIEALVCQPEPEKKPVEAAPKVVNKVTPESPASKEATGKLDGIVTSNRASRIFDGESMVINPPPPPKPTTKAPVTTQRPIVVLPEPKPELPTTKPTIPDENGLVKTTLSSRSVSEEASGPPVAVIGASAGALALLAGGAALFFTRGQRNPEDALSEYETHEQFSHNVARDDLVAPQLVSAT